MLIGLFCHVFDMFAIPQTKTLFFCSHFWKYKPPKGLPGTNPRFLETHTSATNQGLKTVWSRFVLFLKFVARSSNVVALTFRCGSR